MNTPNPRTASRWSLVGAVTAALAASVCCVGPLLLVAFGASGTWIGSLSAMEPYRPIFIILTVGALGWAFYKVYKPRPTDSSCAEGSYCAHPRSQSINKLSLWLVAVFSLVMLISPYVVGMWNPEPAHAGEGTLEVTLVVEGMHCASCSTTVATALKQVEGVSHVKVTDDPPHATVVYDPTLTSPSALTRATHEIGYPSHLLTSQEGGSP